MAANPITEPANGDKKLANGNGCGTIMLTRIVWAGIGVMMTIMVAAGGFFATNTFSSIDRRLTNLEQGQQETLVALAELKAESKKP